VAGSSAELYPIVALYDSERPAWPEQVLQKVEALPSTPGVYTFRDERGRVLYVGKAKVLKNRVRSYFQASRDLHPRTRAMVARIHDLDVIAVDNPKEALVLESNLIKRHRPMFNVKMRDDKRYPMLELTLGDPWPRLKFVRRNTNRESRYFGPYTSSDALRKTMKLLARLFKVRTCKPPLTTPLERPCLDYHIGQCTAPCTRLITQAAYRASVLEACQFLEGHTGRLIRTLRQQMAEASEALEFETCVRLRNLLLALEQVSEKQTVVLDSHEDEDLHAVAEHDGLGCVEVLIVREGRLVEERHFILEEGIAESPAATLRAFLLDYYQEGHFVPPLVLLSHEVDDHEELADYLTDLREACGAGREAAETPVHLRSQAKHYPSRPAGRGLEAKPGRSVGRVSLKVPVRGARRELLDMALRNAAHHLKEALHDVNLHDRRAAGALAELQQALGLPHTPWRIECFDNSNIQGKFPVSSMVVFERAVPKKSDYRRFKIREGDETPDDYRTMREVLTRRFAHRDEESSPFEQLPDLLVVDGGKGQLGVAVEVLHEQGLTAEVPVCGLAKEEELIFLPHQSEPVRLDPRSPALLVLRRLRDESHRFAITFHRNLRGKSLSRSLLDQIPGVGPKRKKDLLRHFGSLGAIMDASQAELAAVPGVGAGVAKVLYETLHPTSAPDQRTSVPKQRTSVPGQRP
jgi:excinuclease ABC subunit C